MEIVRLGGQGWDCNQFLVKDPSGSFDVVDAGHGMDFENVLEALKGHVDPSRIGTLYITHEHFDHTGGIPRWQALGAKVAAGRAAADKLAKGHDPTSEAFGASIPQLAVDHVLDDGDKVSLGGQEWTAMACPGHCPGAVCYWHEGTGTLMSGDVLFADGGIGRFDFPDSDLQAHAHSIRRLARLQVRTLHCGHGPSVAGDAAARSVQGSLAHVAAYT